ncbi:hypothetical protein BKA56DRAFT_607060 [Ilyonectria sp. MPI-CAGE-AT-0026]|nr:hypothetical protein BKA56DRAFT_607060 [Ilyonectria sp. MPI-CAGE-AT-0026]
MPMSVEPTPIPYKVLESCSECIPRPLPGSTALTAVITKTFQVTMPPVVEVTILDGSIGTTNAILKLYDRRFGPNQRDVEGKYSPHSASDEQALASFVEEPRVEGFLSVEEQTKRELIAPPAWGFIDGTP